MISEIFFEQPLSLAASTLAYLGHAYFFRAFSSFAGNNCFLSCLRRRTRPSCSQEGLVSFSDYICEKETYMLGLWHVKNNIFKKDVKNSIHAKSEKQLFSFDLLLFYFIFAPKYKLSKPIINFSLVILNSALPHEWHQQNLK